MQLSLYNLTFVAVPLKKNLRNARGAKRRTCLEAIQNLKKDFSSLLDQSELCEGSRHRDSQT
jgi:hypothetical protein